MTEPQWSGDPDEFEDYIDQLIHWELDNYGA